MLRIQAMTHKRQRNTVRTNKIVHAIHRLVNAMQPMAAQPRAKIPPQPVSRVATMGEFIRHKLVKFNKLNVGRRRQYEAVCNKPNPFNNKKRPEIAKPKFLVTMFTQCNLSIWLKLDIDHVTQLKFNICTLAINNLLHMILRPIKIGLKG